jgi:hypothetical protein
MQTILASIAQGYDVMVQEGKGDEERSSELFMVLGLQRRPSLKRQDLYKCLKYIQKVYES